MLSNTHYHVLAVESGISDDVIRQRGYRSIVTADELQGLGFAPAQCRPPGLLLPLWTTDGNNSDGPGRHVYRPDNPRVVEDRRRKLPDGTYHQRVIKYEQPQGQGVRVDCPPACRVKLGDPAVPLFITEGQKKADALASRGACAVALLGVWNFKGKNEFGGVTFLADFDYIALKGRPVYLVFDSDVTAKQPVRQALSRLTEHLKRKGAAVHVIYLPPLPDGRKCGVDDWLVATGQGVAELTALAEGPRPAPQAAPPLSTLLELAPNRMSRPLALIDGHAYAATWAWVQITTTESIDRRGELVRHNPPKVAIEERLLVIRDDGVIFGDGGDRPLGESGLDMALPEIVPPALRLSVAGLKAYRAKRRPDPMAVFSRVRACVDRFIDFDRSLADQRTMSEMVACYIMATWFLDAFTVAGFLWPNGERGCGKTQLLSVITQLAYLGQLVLAGGSFAALRDMADYGATLAFDDAENLGDPRRTDPDKRTLLLAGNRRGNTVPLKEKDGDNGWRLRYVNTFSFRLFSAIRLPDPVLASRTIVVPLIRTPDRYRANADPEDVSLWPHDRQKLVDDLWMLALAHLPELSAYEKAVNDSATLTGRNLEPWRALLAVAGWLEDDGMVGLRERMEKLSVAYQEERPNVETADLTALVIQALGMVVGKMVREKQAEAAIAAVSANAAVLRVKYFVPTDTLTAAAHLLIESQELDHDTTYVTGRRIGHVLNKMRLERSRVGKSSKRGWMISLDEVIRWAGSYSLNIPEITAIEINPLDVNGGNGRNGGNGGLAAIPATEFLSGNSVSAPDTPPLNVLRGEF
jgi:hypothetical protein